MIRLIAVVCLAVVAMAMPYDQELDSEWLAFQRIYKKNYTTDEEPLRRLIWEDNVQYIEKHNLQADLGLHKFWLGMNEYGDMLLDEFVSVMNGYKGAKFSQCGHFYPAMNVQLPDEVDWRTKGYVTPVKNQGQCGSCWSFSATGSLEGQHFRKTGNLVDLSEKNLMDCSRAEGNHGCNGGMMDQAFEYVIKNKGIDTEASYPYEPRDGPCRFKPENVGATEDSCKDIEEGSESDLQSAVATQGPISVAIDAGHSSFQLYKSGIYEEPKCSSSLLDHGVLVVGYGSENNQDYWLVKNSWGTVWGMQGYIKMARNEHNMCGIATVASFPIV